ncbi:MAG: hypothetical protein RL762_726 [Bacteroidota bacterium]|jgi:hypothetical protein
MKTLITLLILCITSSVIAQIPTYVPSNGLVGWWPFNGNANDESGNGNNGTSGSGVTLISDRFGTSNSAYDFNGNGNISLLNLPTTGSSDFTITSWVKTNDLSVRKGIACWGQDSPWQGTYFYVTANGNLKFDFAYNGGPQSPSFIADSSWHFVGITCTNGLIQLYINGIASGASLQMSPNVNGANKALGANIDNSANNNFIGSLDDFGIWNRALTPTEITNLYNLVNTPAPTVSVSPASTTICPGTPVTLTSSTSGSTACSSVELPSNLQTGLVGYWPFCGNANDASGNGNNGLVNGATLTTDRFGNSGSAYSFDGVDDYISVPNSPALNLIGDFSIYSWVMLANPNVASVSTNHMFILSKNAGITGQGTWHLALESYNNLPYQLHYNADPCFCLATMGGTSSQIANNNWHQLNVTYNSSTSTLKYYIDGILTYTSSQFTYLNQQTLYSLLIGKENVGVPGFFNGKLDDIAIWNRALTAAEIQQLYTSSDATYSWSPGGETTPSITVSPTTTTTYAVTATANGQSSTSTAVVTVTTPPTITASSLSICAGESTTLTVAASGVAPISPCSTLTGSLSTGIVGYWPFCGNASDVSGNGNDGTVNGATLTTDRFGNANSAYNFDGVNDLIRVPHESSLNLLSNYSISIWFMGGDYQNIFNNNWTLISKRDDNGSCCSPNVPYDVFIPFNNTNYAVVGMAYANGNYTFATPPNSNPITSNVWQNITITNSSDNLSFYLNGSNIYSTYLSSAMRNSNISDLLFGSVNREFGAEWMNGKLDDIAIWNRALTTAEIQQLYTQGQTTYSWSPGGATTPSITVSPTSTTTYTCSVTTNGTTCSSDQVITVNPIPLVNAGVDQSVCMGSNVTLGAMGATTYAWSGGVQNGVAFAPTSSGTYTVTGTSNGCSATDGVQVNVMPTAVVSSNPAAICIGQSSTLTATVNGASSPCSSLSGSLSTGLVGYWPFCGNANDVSGNGNNGTVNGATLTTDRFGNLSSAYSFNGSSTTINCSAQGIPTNGSFSVSFWVKPNSVSGYQEFMSQNFSPNAFYLGMNGGYMRCGDTWQNTGVQINTNIWQNIVVVRTFQSGVKIFINGVLIAQLNNDLTINNTNDPLVFGKQYGTNAEYYNGILDDVVTWNRALTTAEIQQLYTQGQTTYSWSPGGATTPSITVSPTSTTTYTYTATTNGVSCPASATVTVNPLPIASISPAGPVNLCQGQSVTLCAPNTPGLTYLWCNASTTSCITTNFAGNYCLVVTDANGCTSNSVSTIVNVAPLPTANAGLDFTKTCVTNPSGTLVGMTPVAGNTYSWTPATGLSSASSANPTANPTSTTTYTLTATNTASGCSATDQVLVSVNTALPTVNAGLDQSLCQGVSTVLNASSNGTSLSWNNGVQNNISFVPSTVGTTTYTATATGSNGCTAIDNVVLTVFNNPVASAGLDATITCVQNASGAQIGDVPNPTYTYSWTPATGLNSATIGNPIANPSTTTTYTVMVVNANGCMGSDQVTVTVNNTPPTANAGLDQSICMGASLVLQGSTNGASGTWNNGVTNGIPFTPSQIGTTSYTYSSIGANGCVNNDQVSVTVNALPVANSGQGAVITCVQNVNGVQLGANPISGNTYTWTPTSGLNNSNSANPTATPNATTTYTLLMLDANGCSDTAQVVVTVNNNPPIVAAGNDANVCNGDSLYLFANATAGSTVVWNSTIQNGSNILLAQSGFQVATATALNGCTAQDSLLVTILQPTTSTLNEVVCDEFVLNGNVYLQTGTYTQLLTNAAGCDSTITLNLTINLSPATPVVYVQNEVNLSTDVVLGQTYQWIYCSDMVPVPAATNPTFNPTANAIYAVVVTNNCGSDTSSCTTVSTIGLADHQEPEIVIYPNPNNGHFSILLPENNGSAKLEVLDLNGRIIFESILNDRANELHLESLSSGTYWLRINQQVPVPVTKY